MTLEANFITITKELGRFLSMTPFKLSNEHRVVGNISVLFQKNGCICGTEPINRIKGWILILQMPTGAPGMNVGHYVAESSDYCPYVNFWVRYSRYVV